MAKRRDPHSHPPQKSTRIDPLPSDKINRDLQTRLGNGKENPVRVSSGGQDEFPIVCPVRIDVARVMGVFEHDTAGSALGLMGHIIDLDFYTKQSRVKMKMYRDPNALTIEVNDEEVYRWIENPDDLPIKLPEVIEKMSQEAHDWIDQVNLQPGDEVIEKDGELVIIRVDGTTEPVDQKEETDEALRYFGATDDPILDDDDPILEDDEDEIIFE